MLCRLPRMLVRVRGFVGGLGVLEQRLRVLGAGGEADWELGVGSASGGEGWGRRSHKRTSQALFPRGREGAVAGLRGSGGCCSQTGAA